MSISFCVGCQKEHEDGLGWKYSAEYEGWVCTKFFKISPPNEYVPESVENERKEYFNATLQPFRSGGELSKEYIEAHGTKGIDVTPEEVKRAKYVWRDLVGWGTRDKSK